MNPIAFALAVPAAFFAGVLVHKYVVSEAQSVKQHISAEIAAWRVDVARLKNKA